MELISDDNYQNLSDDNYISAMNSDDDFDEDDVVVRHPRHSTQYLLADGGDGSEADLLGTTPPRSRIRCKERRKNTIDVEVVQRTVRMRRVGDTVPKGDPSPVNDRFKKRASLKLYRSRERDWKQDMSQREPRADSLPAPIIGPVTPAVPTLVESCNRFMCLTSRLKSRDDSLSEQPTNPIHSELPSRSEELPASRVNFHKTFSMLINMGNVEKGCRRTISREEQVWQNELKDLIWLELQARLAGRSLAQQDAHLCAQRNIVPTIVNNIIIYRFVNPNPCRSGRKWLAAIDGSRENLNADDENKPVTTSYDDEEQVGCLSLACRQCAEATEKAAKEVGTLLDSFHNAVALYPSSQAMTVEHPLVATQLFKNRLKAMCLWYNTATHMRLKMLSVYRMVRSLRRPRRREVSETLSVETSKTCQVRFNLSEASDSSTSDSSNSDCSKEREAECSWSHRNDTESQQSQCGGRESEERHCKENSNKSVQSDIPRGHIREINSKENHTIDRQRQNQESTEGTNKSRDMLKDNVPNHCTGNKLVNGDEVDNTNVGEYFDAGRVTPSVVISDCGRGTADTTASSESGYISEPDTPISDAALLADLTRLRLLGRCAVSPYRAYHYEMLKTQGVRRCMMFMNKMRQHVLHRVHLTLEKPNSTQPESYPEEETTPHVFDDTKQIDKAESKAAGDAYELRRYGCWSEECQSMRLPSYRGQFLALSCVCMEAVHDYLALRLEQRPSAPSCLTVKQLIHELKEGLDIATEMRQEFVRNVRVAVQGAPANDAARADLLLLLRSYDDTVETLLKQYLSYLRTMSATEHMPRAWLRQEWAFAATLAHRAPTAAALAPPAFADISCNQITKLLNEFQTKFESLIQTYEAESPLNRVSAYALCRAVQGAYSGGREPLLHAAQWARVLANKLGRGRPAIFRAHRAAIFEKLMSMREFTMSHTELVLERTRVPDEELELTEGLLTRVRELLLQMFKLGFEIHKELHSAVQEPKRNQNQSQPPRTASPPRLRPKYSRVDSVSDDVFDDRLFDSLCADTSNESSLERLLSGEDCDEPVQLRHPNHDIDSVTPGGTSEESEWAFRVGRAVIQFAKCWMRFVVERCDRGRGLRPRWASQGLEFLMLACDPCNTRHLTEEEFEELKQLMDGCISHVVGSRPAPDSSLAARPRPRLQSPSPSSSPTTSVSGATASGSCPRDRDAAAPSTPPIEPDPLLSFHVYDNTSRAERVRKAVETLEEERDNRLRQQRRVGRVAGPAPAAYEPKLKQVTFKWQRGLKIGAGSFGKVYTVVNTESGQLLAMKELSIIAGDRRALQKAANELRVLEGVIHPHLVRYYGCELHREEMLIFMELCVEGSLEALIATTGALEEHTTRRYAKQLVSAILELHARNIAHRDIKSGNIFLTNEGHCLKLGDFGCAVKIRANTTAPGELQGFVGTQAYMAPEVFMKSSGHGRAADVWSLGCVVTEMGSGQRPFVEYDSNYQIMFVVGMGGRPDIPEGLSPEGRDFCLQCLTHDPDVRPRADQLSMHHFLMVKSDDDCKCQPGYLVQ